jgi:class 3 adenylate cyclase
MSQENLTLAILFADIAKSTRIYEIFGDKKAQDLIANCISIFKKAILKNHGTVIKTIGDEIMATFPGANEAVRAAIEMNEALEGMTFGDDPGFVPPNIYVGIQYGPVIREAGDVFGDAVNVAARMRAQAKQRQIFTTEETVNALTGELRESARLVDSTTIKGKSGKMDIYEIVWEKQDVTVMMDDSFESMLLRSRIELRHAELLIEVDESRPAVSLGRQLHNDIVVNDGRASRSHARVEYRRGKFVLVDQSANGTYIMVEGKPSVRVNRDETPLVGKGLIGLGKEVRPDSPEAIHFAIKL